ncbi:MAG: ankyrin repeat domain-containing protein [Planctomycetes bacterium]|nr:ankyrin repeat domain-containing protein [Planctomycetota bacterium]
MPTVDDLLAALTSRSLDRFRELLAADAGLASARDAHGVSVLMTARYHQRFDMVEAVLEQRGDDLDVFESAALGKLSRLTRLLAQDPKLIDAYSPDGFTPLQLATFFAEPATAKLLLQRGANVELVSKNPMALRAIHSAAAGGSAEIVERVVLAGADVNARQHGGFTALQAAAGAGRMDMTRFLLAHGAERNVRNDAGKSARDLAHEKGHVAVVQLLDGASRSV